MHSSIGKSDAAVLTESREGRPLIVDLDGTLVHTDLLHESYFASVGAGLSHHMGTLRAFRQGKASLKSFLAAACEIKYANLPYRESVLSMIASAREAGRPVYLATAGAEKHAHAIADHLQLFDGVFASNDVTNLKGATKASMLVDTFGEKGFDYIGDSLADMAVWAKAERAYSVCNTPRLVRAAARHGVELEALETPAPSIRTWVRALRMHQYAKNLLIFVPLVSSQSFTLDAIAASIAAFVAFSICASAVYLLNDTIDIEADRQHATKKKRPIAAGSIPIHTALSVAALLLVAGLVISLFVSPTFGVVLLFYIALTTAYSLWLKRKMLVDVVTLASLYTTRVIAGAAAIAVVPSEWLLAFCLFIFASLALIKRYVELVATLEKNLPDPKNRNYRKTDLPIVSALAAASGMNAVIVLALYISSPEIQAAYTNPWLLWLSAPILMYWLARALMIAHRRTMNDDPIVFAIRDRVSRAAFVILGLIFVAAL